MTKLTRIALAAVTLLGACDDDDEDVVGVVPVPGDLDRCFTRTDLVGSVAGSAVRTDVNLINGWGITPVLDAFAVVSADAGRLAIYNPDGSPAATAVPNGLPIGDEYTGITTLGSTVVLVSQEGLVSTIDTLNDPSRVRVASDLEASGAGYFGVAAFQGGVLAADFHRAQVTVFDAQFQQLNTPAFVNSAVPPGYAPFNVAVFGDRVYVAYALQDAAMEDEVAGPGLGYLSAFDPNGGLLWTIGGGTFNAPWGMAIAPAGFGDLAGTLLVGNFGDGLINIVELSSQRVLGQLSDVDGTPIATEGLWGLSTGAGVSASRADSIYFAAGPADESQGLYGVIEPCR